MDKWFDNLKEVPAGLFVCFCLLLYRLSVQVQISLKMRKKKSNLVSFEFFNNNVSNRFENIK